MSLEYILSASYFVLLCAFICVCIVLFGGDERDFSLSGFILYLIVRFGICDTCGPKHSVFSHGGATGILSGTILSCSELHPSSQGGKHFDIPSRSAGCTRPSAPNIW